MNDIYTAMAAFGGGIFGVASVCGVAGWMLSTKFNHVYQRIEQLDKTFTAAMTAHEAKDVERFTELKLQIIDKRIQATAAVISHG